MSESIIYPKYNTGAVVLFVNRAGIECGVIVGCHVDYSPFGSYVYYEIAVGPTAIRPCYTEIDEVNIFCKIQSPEVIQKVQTYIGTGQLV